LVIDPLIHSREAGSPLRVWVPGCATGQEPYSIAILLSERMEALKKTFDVKIFATDINESALEAARAGVFNDQNLEKVSPARRKRFFITAEKGGWQIAKAVR